MIWHANVIGSPAQLQDPLLSHVNTVDIFGFLIIFLDVPVAILQIWKSDLLKQLRLESWSCG